MSSTALVLQTFKEKGLSKNKGAESAFSILLFQDLAVIPILAILPLLAGYDLAVLSGQHSELSLVEGLSPFLSSLISLSTVCAVIVFGIFFSGPMFRFVARTNLSEVFTATTLLLIVGIASLMSLVGLSPALGTFLAGVVLANSEFSHELASDLEPFEGILMGLFFITVGAGIDFAIFEANAAAMVIGAVTLMSIKATVLYLLAKGAKLDLKNGMLMSLSLCQAGEFGFVLSSFSFQNGVISAESSAKMSLIIAISMLLTPFVFIVYDKLFAKSGVKEARQDDQIKNSGRVLILGLGRFGQIVNRFLIANQVETIVVDSDLNHIELMKKVNIKAYYGNANRTALLDAAGLESSDLVILAYTDGPKMLKVLKYIKRKYPKKRVVARAYDRKQSYELIENGADEVVKDTYYSALEMGAVAMENLGYHPYYVETRKLRFDKKEHENSKELYNIYSNLGGEQNLSEFNRLFIDFEKSMLREMKRMQL